MSIYNFKGHILTELFGKNWQLTTNIKTNVFNFYTSSFMSSRSFSQLTTANLQYNGIKTTKQYPDLNCVKSVRIRGWSGSYYATFWVNTGTYSVSLHVESKCGKKFAPEKSSEHAHFPQSDQVLWLISLNLYLWPHLEIFPWFRKSFRWCSMINSFSLKHK